jgi:GNAT superfamily N-acetyltransferase
MTLAAVPPTRDGERDQSERSTPASLGKITTRPSVAEDSAFMLELYASTSKDVLDDLGWSIGGQRTFVIMQAQAEEWNRARLYPGMDRLTICVDEMPVGRLLVCLRNNILHMVDLSLLPRFRGLGIGTQLMGEIIEEARNARVPVKVRVRKDTSGVRFVERLGFSTPTDLGAFVELTWMPPLTALGPDDRDDGFTSHGTRSNRATPTDDLGASTDATEEMPDGMVSIETARVAELQAEEIVAGVAAEAAAAADARETADAAEALRMKDAAETAPIDMVDDVAEATDADTADADEEDPTDETDESAELLEDVHSDVNQAVQQYVAETDAEYLAEPVWLAPEVVVEDEEDLVEEEEEEEVVEEDPEVAARNAEFLESVTATDAFTSTFTANFSAEVVEDVLEEEEVLPFGADRYDPFA